MLDDNKMDSVKEDVKNNQELDQEYRSCETQDESEIKDAETSCDNYHPMNIDETSDEVSRGYQDSEDELRELDVELIESKINELSYYVEETNVDIGVLEEYARRLAEFKRRKLDLNNAVQKRDEVKEQLGILKKKRFDEFMAGFNIISMTLKEMYQMITMGGNAELELVDSLDPFSEGVTFSVMPPKKSWRNITNLSGGEKTLSSLALVFALHKYKPTPFMSWMK